MIFPRRKHRMRFPLGIKLHRWQALLLFVGLNLVAGFATAAYVIHYRETHKALTFNDEPRLTLPAGTQFMGVAASYVDNVRASPDFVPMRPQAMCAWGEPGRNPWRGDTYSALLAMNIPLPTAAKLAARIKTGQTIHTGYVSNKEVWSEDQMQFSPFMAMTFGESLCFGTRANFKDATHVESGKLYEESGYWVFVPDVCGNVTRLIPLFEAQGNKELVLPPTPHGGGFVVGPGGYMVPKESYEGEGELIPGIPRRAQPYPAPNNYYQVVPTHRKPRHGPNTPDTPGQGQVPEPGWVFLAGLIPLIAVLRRKKNHV